MYFFSSGGKLKPSTDAARHRSNCFLIRLRHSHNKLAGVPTMYTPYTHSHNNCTCNYALWNLCLNNYL